VKKSWLDPENWDTVRPFSSWSNLHQRQILVTSTRQMPSAAHHADSLHMLCAVGNIVRHGTAARHPPEVVDERLVA
jgi:hypothetical protein